MKTRTSALLGLWIALLLAASTALFAAEESGSETHRLEAGGRISLSNVNGPVKVEGWDRDEVQIDWIKTARFAEDLDRMEVRIEASAGWVDIETRYERSRGWGRGPSGEVEYHVRVPRTAELDGVETVNGRLEIRGIDGDVHASTVNGRLEARELGGSVELETVNGPLEAYLYRLSGRQRVELETVNGSLDVRIPASADADVEAETLNGRISNDFDLEVRKGRYVGRSLSGTIGRGGPLVRLESVNGSIDIRREG